MPINWTSVNAFLACGTQWRVASRMAVLVWIGLDYSAVDVVLKRRNADAVVFDDILVMEAAALKTFVEVGA